MFEFSRRDILIAFGSAGTVSVAMAQQVHRAVESVRQTDGYVPQFFTTEEFETIRVLVNLVLPADESSKGASDAGVPEFIDYICSVSENQGGIYRDGLRWIDTEMERRTGGKFRVAAMEQQLELLDVIAYRRNSNFLTEAGVRFFSYLRGMVVGAYYSSPVGMADLGYLGNQVLDSFTVPEEAVKYALRRSPFGEGM